MNNSLNKQNELGIFTMRMTLPSITLIILFSINVFADGYLTESSQDQPWSITASVGQGKYQHNYFKERASALTRLSLDNELLISGDVAWGLELGVQNGNHIHLQIPYEALALVKWIPIRTSLGPMLDLLITAKTDPLGESLVFAQLKGGLAYRHWKIKQLAIENLSQLAAEIQAGVGYPITALASLNLFYQGIFGNEPDYQYNRNTQIGHISSIPILHGILLGFSVNL